MEKELDTQKSPLRLLEECLAEVADLPEQESRRMILATVDKDGQPHARAVLLRELDSKGLVFYTNYKSRKGDEIAHNPKVELCMHWEKTNKQLRVSGIAERAPSELSDTYFSQRDRGSRIGAWASKQSQVMAESGDLMRRFGELDQRWGEEVPRPEFWGGYRVLPSRMEFWQLAENRLHHRIEFKFPDPTLWAKSWRMNYLYP